MERSKRTTTRIAHLSSLTKNKQKNPKKISPYDKRLVVQQYIKCFKFIMTPTHGKTCGLRRRNGTITLPLRKTRSVGSKLL